MEGGERPDSVLYAGRRWPSACEKRRVEKVGEMEREERPDSILYAGRRYSWSPSLTSK